MNQLSTSEPALFTCFKEFSQFDCIRAVGAQFDSVNAGRAKESRQLGLITVLAFGWSDEREREIPADQNVRVAFQLKADATPVPVNLRDRCFLSLVKSLHVDLCREVSPSSSEYCRALLNEAAVQTPAQGSKK